jgi:hypothetical protein
MSSHTLRPLPESRDALLAAAADVAENSLFTIADAADEAAFNEAAAGVDPGRWLRAIIPFTGPTSGIVALTVPEALARRLCTAFSGATSPEDIATDDLVDFTGELASMMCGAWFTRACQHESFDLQPPRVVRGGLGGGHVPAEAPSHTFYLAIDETPVKLEIGHAEGAAHV